MKKLFVLGMAAAMLAAACAAYAVPTLAGPTGLFNAPTGYVACPGELDLAVDYLSKTETSFVIEDPVLGRERVVSEGHTSWPIRVLYGIGSGFEVGAAYDANGFAGKGFWDINAKYQLPWNWYNSAIAIGALYGQADTNDVLVVDEFGNVFTLDNTTKYWEVYLAGTHCFNVETLPIAVTLGVNWAQLEAIDKHSGWRVQLGADATVAKGFDILADVQSKTSRIDDDPLWSAGVRYLFCPALTVEAGVDNGILFGGRKAAFFIGANYAFNLASK